MIEISRIVMISEMLAKDIKIDIAVIHAYGKWGISYTRLKLYVIIELIHANILSRYMQVIFSYFSAPCMVYANQGPFFYLELSKVLVINLLLM